MKINIYADILEVLSVRNIEYCVARNYENHPHYDGDLDLFIAPKFVDQLRRALIDYCDTHPGVRLLESSQYSAYVAENQKIFVFYIIDSYENRLFQIDAFMGFSLWGICILSSSEIIEKRLQMSNGIYKISAEHELIIKWFQIQSYKKSKNNLKVLRYTRQLQSLYSSAKSVDLPRYLSINIDRLLREGRFPSYYAMLLIRLSLMIRRMSYKNFGPLSRITYFVFTLVNIPKHCVITKISEEQINLIKHMKRLSNKGFFRVFLVTRPSEIKKNIYQIYKITERGGVIVIQNDKKTSEPIGDTFLNIESEILENFRRRCKNY